MKRLLLLLPLVLLAFLVASCGSPAEPYYSEGKAHHEKGEYEEAIEDFTEAIRLDPNHAGAYCMRGVAHYEMGEYRGGHRRLQ